MATLEEQETQITINRADLKDGYFRFGTSEVGVFNKLLKKCPQRELIELRESKKDGKSVYWSCKVPSKYLNRSPFSLRIPTKSPRTEKQRLASLAQGKALAERRQKHA